MSHNFNQGHTKKSSRIIVIFVLGFVALVIGLFIASGPNSPTGNANGGNSGKSPLSAQESFYDFGTISMAKGKVSKTYKIKNPSSETITISKVYTSCMCTKATLYNGDRKAGPFGMPGHGVVPTISETLAPGAEADIEAVFDPAAHGPSGVGSIARTIFIETTDGGKLSLDFKAQVTP